jgi:hypothetical protein
MLKKFGIFLFFITLFGCASVSSIGSDLSAKPGESEILINIGNNTIYNGWYNIYINGDFRNEISRKGGTAKYIVPNGQHVISVEWRGTPGTPTLEKSMEFTIDSERVIFYVLKPNVEDLTLKLEGKTRLDN